MSFTPMTDVPNPLFDSNGDPFSGAVLKAYLPGTTTAISIYTDAAGSSPQATLTANAQGAWEVTGSEVVPYIDQDHKWGIFANASDAASNTPFYMGPFDNVTAGIPLTSPNLAIIFDNVADMISGTLPDGNTIVLAVGQTVQTLGYITEGDGGDNTYEIVAASTGTDDGGSFIDLNVLQAKGLFPGGIYRPEHWGSKVGEDSSPAFQAAFAFGVTKLVGRDVTYQFNSLVTLATGQGFVGTNSAYNGTDYSGTILTTANDINIFVCDNRYTHLSKFVAINTGTSTKAAIECTDNKAYFNLFEDIITSGFKYGVQGERTLYQTHTRCNYDDCEIGANYIVASGTWNTDWFNNTLTFTDCTFRRNTTKGAFIKGVGVTFNGEPDCSSCPIGIEIEGESTGSRAHDITIIGLYSESTNNPIKATYADVTLVGGFMQGQGSPVAGDQPFLLDDATVTIEGKLGGQDLWDTWATLTNGSILKQDEDVFFGISGALSTKVSLDSTSELKINTSRSENTTGTITRNSLTDTSISFTSNNTIFDSNNGLGIYSIGQNIAISGTASNDQIVEVATVSASTITTVETSIVTEAAGASVTLNSGLEDLFTPSLGGAFDITAVSSTVGNIYWIGSVLRAGTSATLRITEDNAGNATMHDHNGVLMIENNSATPTVFEWSYIKRLGR